jgi:hypothetical protein
MPTARDATIAIVQREIVASAIISSFALVVSGCVCKSKEQVVESYRSSKDQSRTVTLEEKVLFHRCRCHFALLPVAARSLDRVLTHFTPHLDSYKTSRLGAYLARYMTATAQGARLAGDLITVVAAWYQSPVGILIGLGFILAAWTYGLLSFSQN